MLMHEKTCVIPILSHALAMIHYFGLTELPRRHYDVMNKPLAKCKPGALDWIPCCSSQTDET